MKLVGILLIGLGAVLTPPSLLLSAIALSDASQSCPGNQCGDAVSSAVLGAAAAGIGAILVGVGVFLTRRQGL